MYERVLFPTDGSPGADAATDHALAAARRFEAPLHALYVVDVTAGQATDVYGHAAIDTALDAREEAGEEVLEAVRERAEGTGVEVTATVTEGRPASAIVEAAGDEDVIVMGTHGRTGLERYLIGSTTEKVVRTADVCVLTVPQEESDQDGRQA